MCCQQGSGHFDEILVAIVARNPVTLRDACCGQVRDDQLRHFLQHSFVLVDNGHSLYLSVAVLIREHEDVRRDLGDFDSARLRGDRLCRFVHILKHHVDFDAILVNLIGRW